MTALTRLAAYFRGRGMVDHILNKYGATFEGQFSPEPHRITGHVGHWRHISAEPPRAVIAVRSGEIIGSTSEFIGPGRQRHFVIPVAVATADIMRGELQIFAVDSIGGRSMLKINGEDQLRFVQQAKAVNEVGAAPIPVPLTHSQVRATVAEVRQALTQREGHRGPLWDILPTDRTDIPPSAVELGVAPGLPVQIEVGSRMLSLAPGYLDFFIHRLAYVMPLIEEVMQQNTSGKGAILLSLGDGAGVRGAAFCSDNPGDILVPDTNFITSNAYADMRGVAAGYPYADRLPLAFWRGSTTGIWPNGDWEHMQRIQLCRVAKAHPKLIDARITGLSENVKAQPGAQDALTKEGLIGERTPTLAQFDYRYQIDVDGNTNSWPGLFIKLLTGSPILKIASPKGYRQWYYDRLVPWQNFVPVEANMSDLVDKVVWLKANDTHAREIGRASLALAMSLDYETEIRAGADRLIAALH